MSQRLPTTRAQRLAVYRLFRRHYGDAVASQCAHPLSERLFANQTCRSMYRLYRRRFSTGGFAGDYYLFGQPYDTGEGQLWVGIEPDGYTHS